MVVASRRKREMNVLSDGGNSDLDVNVLSNKDTLGITTNCTVSLPYTQLPSIILTYSANSLFLTPKFRTFISPFMLVNNQQNNIFVL